MKTIQMIDLSGVQNFTQYPRKRTQYSAGYNVTKRTPSDTKIILLLLLRRKLIKTTAMWLIILGKATKKRN